MKKKLIDECKCTEPIARVSAGWELERRPLKYGHLPNWKPIENSMSAKEWFDKEFGMQMEACLGKYFAELDKMCRAIYQERGKMYLKTTDKKRRKR